ncbi:MAG: hypothetical protein R3E96_17355, partial [Planctomycetota bacterium]
MRTFRRLLPLCLILAACASHAALPPAPFSIDQVSERHRASFEALLDSLESGDTPAAESLLRGLLPRLEAEAHSGDESLALEADWQWKAAQRFERIVQGRKRMQAIHLSLDVHLDRTGHGTLRLAIESDWPEALELRPGSLVLREEVTWLSAGGDLASNSYQRIPAPPGGWSLPPLGRIEVDLEPYSEFPLAGALAMRQVYTLRLGAGSIGTDGDVLPAEGWPMVRGLRVSLPEVLPNASLPAGPLLESLANPDSSAPARMERLARLRPSEYGVALEGCREALLAATP